jgi:hypothetical protein
MMMIMIIIKNAKSEQVWKERIHETIECYRKDLAILNEFKKGVLICLKANNIFKEVHNEQEHQRTGTKH